MYAMRISLPLAAMDVVSFVEMNQRVGYECRQNLAKAVQRSPYNVGSNHERHSRLTCTISPSLRCDQMVAARMCEVPLEAWLLAKQRRCAVGGSNMECTRLLRPPPTA